jgi:hypothetical protein
MMTIFTNCTSEQYKKAEVALLSPDYLFQYGQKPDHDVFIRSFEGIFLTDDAERSGLPSTDCLENFPNGRGVHHLPKADGRLLGR